MVHVQLRLSVYGEGSSPDRAQDDLMGGVRFLQESWPGWFLRESVVTMTSAINPGTDSLWYYAETEAYRYVDWDISQEPF